MIKELVMYQMKKVWELHNSGNLLNKVKQIIQNKSQSAKFMFSGKLLKSIFPLTTASN